MLGAWNQSGFHDRSIDRLVWQASVCFLTQPCSTIAQVRPKPPTPINVPIAPAPPPMVAAPLIQRPLMLTTKLTSTLPASAGPIHQVHIVNGQQYATIDKTTTAVTSGTTQVTGIVISPAKTLQISNINSNLKVSTPIYISLIVCSRHATFFRQVSFYLTE